MIGGHCNLKAAFVQLGALRGYITGGAESEIFQPMNVNFDADAADRGDGTHGRAEEGVDRPCQDALFKLARETPPSAITKPQQRLTLPLPTNSLFKGQKSCGGDRHADISGRAVAGRFRRPRFDELGRRFNRSLPYSHQPDRGRFIKDGVLGRSLGFGVCIDLILPMPVRITAYDALELMHGKINVRPDVCGRSCFIKLLNRLSQIL